MPQFDVTIAGELNLDLILYGLPAELPEERELLAQSMMLTLGSSSAIVAHNLSALGCRVGFVSRIGDDPLGQIAIDRLAAGGVDISRVRRVAGATKTGLTVILQRGLTAHVGEILRKLKAAGLTVSLDTNDDPDNTWAGGLLEVLRYVDVFMPNARELKLIAGTEDFEEAVARVAKRVPVLVVKMGEQGAIAQRGSERITSPAVKVQFVDPVGAGDSFDAGFLSRYVRGADLQTCLEWGNRAGAWSTTQPGGTEAFRDREATQEFLGSGH